MAFRLWVYLALPAAVGFVLVLVATHHGIGLPLDSTTYIGWARRIAGTAHQPEPLPPFYPPLYPLVLSIPSFFGCDMVVASRGIQAALMAANVCIAGALVAKHTRNILAALVGACLVLLSETMFDLHTSALSEPLAMALGFGSILILVSGDSTRALAGGALLAGFSCLTRYASLSFICAGCLILLFVPATYSGRVKRFALFAFIAFSFVVVWRIVSQSMGIPAQVRPVFHPPTFEHLNSALYVISTYLLPQRVPGFWKKIALAIFFLAAAHLGLKWRALSSVSRIPQTLMIFCGCYLLIILLNLTFNWANTPLDDRILAPVFFAGVVLAVCVVADVARVSPAVKTVAILIAAALLTSYAVSISARVKTAYDQGLEGNYPALRRSRLMQSMCAMPQNAVLFSNAATIVAFHCDRPVQLLPVKHDLLTAGRNERYESQRNAIDREVRIGPAYVAVFNDYLWMPNFPKQDELRSEWRLDPLLTAQEGILYSIKDR